MKLSKTSLCFVLLISHLFSVSVSSAAPQTGNWLNRAWHAEWSAHPDGPEKDPAAFLFRKQFELMEKPNRFIIHSSADQRYHLYVNGERVATGPARGDLLHWRYETFDIASHLKQGKNVVAARVWSEGDMAPWAQLSAHTAFILQGEGDIERALDTPYGWRVTRDNSWTPTQRPGVMPSHHVTGANERITASQYPWDWMSADFDETKWARPVGIASGVPIGLWGDGSSLWQLVPRNIPMMEERLERLAKVVRAKRVNATDDFIKGNSPVTIPPKTKATVLFDHGVLTNAYPEIVVSGGVGSKIRLSYEESLFKSPEVDMGRLIKGNRNDVKKCGIRADYKFDEFLPDGGNGRTLSTLWWRTFRYLQMDIETGDAPLTIDDLRAVATGYPYETKAMFDSSDPELRTIWSVGWRTARLCAVETYFDCPYYEQLQYAGDTRIQMLISYYVAGDDRLARNAIELLNDSRIPEGLTQSRYPSRMTQIIPPFSLAWIGMIRDYWMFNNDEAFFRQYLDGMRGVLNWFEKYRRPNGLEGKLPWWNFVDWSWPGGTPSGANDIGSSIISMQYALALRDVADIEESFGYTIEAKNKRALADKIIQSVRKTCWDEKRLRLSDSPNRDTFSQHAAVLGVLSGAIPKDKWKVALTNAMRDKSIAQCTLYFRHFLHKAILKAGMGDQLISMLTPWREILTQGLTTWPETPTDARSDCHAWSSTPTIDLLSIVCGVRPDAPGFQRVKIEPHISNLAWVKCEVPHAKGMIRVHIRQTNGQSVAVVELPPGLPGVFSLHGKEIPLHSGKQTVKQ